MKIGVIENDINFLSMCGDNIYLTQRRVTVQAKQSGDWSGKFAALKKKMYLL